MRRLLLVLSLVAPGALASPALSLWYAQPAAKWTEALPIGNGRLGAMVFGGVAEERIQFNEGTLWTGQPRDYVRQDAGKYLAPLRALVAEGKTTEAHRLAKEHFVGDPARQKAYQPFGDIHLRFPLPPAGANAASTTAPAANAGATTPPPVTSAYRRELDLEAGVSRTTYTIGAVTFQREAFASYPDNVIVVRLTASQPGQLNLEVAVDSPHRSSSTRSIDGDTLVLSGEVEPGGLRFESRLVVRTEGGTAQTKGSSIEISRATTVTLVLAAATSFKSFQDISANPSARCVETLARVKRRSFADLRAGHARDFEALARRAALDLGTTEAAALPTDQRLTRIKQSGVVSDPALVALYFQYGRYLLISSSRAGGQPANLQGIWNAEMDPPWESKWTTNINLEMNYWPAEPTNIGECTAPLFDLIDDLVVSGGRTAREQYGADGWVLHHNTDLWRGTAPVNNIDGVWPTGGAWLCQHLWDHYLFTQDRTFLAGRAYPVMKEASRFFLSTLVKDPQTGWLVTNPSYSPEQGGLTIGPTMDIQLIRALFAHTRAAAELLHVDPDLAAKIAAAEAALPPALIGKHGQLQEWLTDVDKPNNAHRHMSPLWALYPGNDITPADEKVLAAAKLLLKWRGEGSTGWSYAWRIPLWARVGDGEFAYRQLDQLLNRRTLPNLFDLCGPFQIDGNFGATAGIAELLLQSHTRSERGDTQGVPVIALLPALPKAWPTGSFHGLRARGGFELDIAWKEGQLTRAEIRGSPKSTARVGYAGKFVDVTIPAAGRITLNGSLHP